MVENQHDEPRDLRSLARRLALRTTGAIFRRPALGAFRKYADWVERSSSVEVTGPGAAYAGKAVYLCRPAEAPLAFLHRAHFDDRALFGPGLATDILALYAQAAGLVVSRDSRITPEVERSIRAGNAAIFIVDDSEAGRQAATLAATLAWRAKAPLIVLSARSRREVELPLNGHRLAWPMPSNTLLYEYGQLHALESEDQACAEHVLRLIAP